MAYIGPEPAESFTSFATQEFSTSATTSYTLDHAVANENEIALFVNNVRQQPGSGKAYTATGTALTLSAATASTDTMYCVFLGRALQTVTPATNSITAAMVGNDLISGKDALASEPADTDEFLVSDAGTLKRIDYSLIKGGGITEADSWRITANFSTTTGYITANWERNDTYGYSKLGTGMSESSGVFSFPSTGHYLILFNGFIDDASTTLFAGIQLELTQDNSSYDVVEANYGNIPDTNAHSNAQIMYHADITNVSTHKVRFRVNAGDTVRFAGSTTVNNTSAKFIKLADT
jgi:hypothetical protein